MSRIGDRQIGDTSRERAGLGPRWVGAGRPAGAGWKGPAQGLGAWEGVSRAGVTILLLCNKPYIYVSSQMPLARFVCRPYELYEEIPTPYE